ncbi:MAG: sugar phosphate isomerase/epimerase family protein, partial [Bacteroidales bacterium]
MKKRLEGRQTTMFMTYPYVLSEDVSGTALAWEGEMANAFSFIASCGYKGIELLVHQPGVVETRRLSGLLKENGLHAVALGTGLLEKRYGLTLVHQKEYIRKEAVLKMKRIIDIADKLEASVVIGRFRGRWKHLGNLDLAESYFHKALEQLLPYAQKRNVSL